MSVYNRALKLSIKGKYWDAIMLLQQQGDKTDAEVWVLIGRSYSHIEGEAVNAVSAFHKALRIDKSCISAYCFLSRTYEELEKVEKAEECIDAALEIKPDKPELWVEKASFCMNRNSFIEAFQIADNLEQEGFTSSAYKIRARGNVMFALEDNDFSILHEALANWNSAIKYDPTDYEAWMDKAETLELMGEYKDAIQAVNRVLEISPGYEVAKKLKKELSRKRLLGFIPGLVL